MGETPRVATEIYLPAGYRSRWFLAPHAEFQIRTLPIVDEDERILAEYRVRTTDFGVDLGRELGNYGEIRVGCGPRRSARRACASAIRCCRRRSSTRTISSANSATTPLDNVNFPRHGASFQLGWEGERESGARDSESADLLVFDQLYAQLLGPQHRASSGPRAGTRLDNDVDIVRSYFSLGGFLNMSGITPETLVGPHFAIARGIYYRQIGRGGQGFLNVPVYLGRVDREGQRVERAPRHLVRRAPGPTAACSWASTRC